MSKMRSIPFFTLTLTFKTQKEEFYNFSRLIDISLPIEVISEIKGVKKSSGACTISFLSQKNGIT